MKIYCEKGCMKASKIILFLRHLGIPYDLNYVEESTFDFVLSKTKLGALPLVEAFLNGNVPRYFSSPDSLIHHITKTRCRETLVGNNETDEIDILDWSNVISSKIEPLLELVLKPILRFENFTAVNVTQKMDEIGKLLEIIEDNLGGNCYFIGYGLSIVDFQLLAMLYCPFKKIYIKIFSEKFKKLTRYLDNLESRLHINGLDEEFRQISEVQLLRFLSIMETEKRQNMENKTRLNSPELKIIKKCEFMTPRSENIAKFEELERRLKYTEQYLEKKFPDFGHNNQNDTGNKYFDSICHTFKESEFENITLVKQDKRSKTPQTDIFKNIFSQTPSPVTKQGENAQDFCLTKE